MKLEVKSKKAKVKGHNTAGVRFYFLLFTFYFVATAAVRAENESVAPPINRDAAPHRGEFLDLFGHQSPAVKDETAKPATTENREIKHPDAPAQSNASAAELKSIDRRTKESARWHIWDAMPLLAVLALIAGVGLVMKRFFPRRNLLGGSRILEIVTRTPLSPKQNLVLVKMGRRLLLLGVSADRISALCNIDDPEEAARLVGEVASHQPGSMNNVFPSSMADETGQYQDVLLGDDPAETAGGHVRGLLEKIRNLKKDREVA